MLISISNTLSSDKIAKSHNSHWLSGSKDPHKLVDTIHLVRHSYANFISSADTITLLT